MDRARENYSVAIALFLMCPFSIFYEAQKSEEKNLRRKIPFHFLSFQLFPRSSAVAVLIPLRNSGTGRKGSKTILKQDSRFFQRNFQVRHTKNSATLCFFYLNTLNSFFSTRFFISNIKHFFIPLSALLRLDLFLPETISPEQTCSSLSFHLLFTALYFHFVV